MLEKPPPIPVIGVRSLNKQKAEEINNLLKQLSNSPPELFWGQIGEILSQPNFNLVILEEPETGKIVGMASLVVNSTFMRTVGQVEDVIVDEQYRGRHLGEMLIKYLISMAKLKKCSYISLTSNPKRVAANAMYQKIGFQLTGKVGESNYYRLYL